MEKATTFDLLVMDLGIRYEHYRDLKAQGKWKKPTPKLSEEEMLKMIKDVKYRKRQKTEAKTYTSRKS